MQTVRDVALLAGEPDACDVRVGEILRQWIDEDRKATPLKALQGYIWADGYARGALQGHVYDDAAVGLRRWNAQGLALYVYSSGSIAAQKLLFKHSTAGDLTTLFTGYFDTTIGAKTDADAYRNISLQIAVPPAELLFLSDRTAELEAAHAAGWQVALVARDEDQVHQKVEVSTTAGTALSLTADDSSELVLYPTVRSFDNITIAS